MKPVHVFVDRQELVGYTGLTLTRAKKEMTGQLNLEVFMGWLPDSPPLVEVTAGREVLVYIGGYLAFTGIIDRRKDESQRLDANLSIGPDAYKVTFACRGKTKYLVDSSHQHPTGTILRPSNRTAIEELIDPFGVELVWQSEELELDKLRLRDGGRVSDELQRVAEQCSLFIYESLDGKLVVDDGTETPAQGEALALGTNILNFTTDQLEDLDRSQVLVKGQRIEKDVWGTDAVLPTLVNAARSSATGFSPITVQMYGNGTDELLQKRATFEINKRNAESRQVTLDVFHVQQTDGRPWDLGRTHAVSIPPAGINETMEVVKLVYTIQADKTLKTTLTLAPPPAPPTAGNSEFMGGSGAKSTEGAESIWASPSDVTYDDEGNAIYESNFYEGTPEGDGQGFLTNTNQTETPVPLALPPGYDEGQP